MATMWRRLGQGMRYGTLAICVLAVVVGVSRGQFGPKGGGVPRPPQPIPQPPFPRPPQPQPFIPPPRPDPFINQPVIVTEWFCTRCRHVLGHGPIQPNVATCPGCGARLVGGGFGGGPPPGGNPGNPPPGGGPVIDLAERKAPGPRANADVPTSSILIFIVAGAICGFIGLCVLIGGTIFLIVSVAGSGKTRPKKRRRRRDDPFDD